MGIFDARGRRPASKKGRVLAWAAALALSACGGGGSGVGGGAPAPAGPGPDAADRLAAVLEHADTLLSSGRRTDWLLSSLPAGKETIGDAGVEAMTCTGTSCVGEDGMATTLRDLTGPFSGTAGAALGTRGGFDTATVAEKVGDVVDRLVDDIAVTASPTVTSWGFWGEHGFAALAFGEGRLTAEVDGAAFGGTFALATAYALGDASGTNPTGTGSATWEGIAEATPTDTFYRLKGTAEVTIEELSDPRPLVSVDIRVPGHAIGGWADGVPLTAGRFASGTFGKDYLAGNFHGPNREEVWGVFDTADYLGTFGAKRRP